MAWLLSLSKSLRDMESVVKIYVAINYSHENKEPIFESADASKAWWNKFNGAFQNKYIEIPEFVLAIQAGYAYTTQHKRYRKAEQFLAGNHLALDFDTMDERSTFESLSQNPFIAKYASFLYTTPSHTEEKPRCRVVFVLDRPVLDGSKFALLAESLVYRFGLADTKCRDCCRIFYGSKNCQVLELGNVLTLEDAAEYLVKPYLAFQEQQRLEHEARLKEMQVVSANGVPESWLEKHSRTLLDKVRLAPQGEKYATLRDISRTMGGYVGGGYYNRLDVENWLQAAIASNGNNVKDLNHAYQTIRQGLDYGSAEPLYFEVKKEEIPLEKVQPPLTEEQKKQVAVIIRDLADKEYWRGYHEGMGSRERWYELGFTDWVIDNYNLGFAYADRDTGELMNALTVPSRSPTGNVTNIEYRSDNIRYECDLVPPLFFTEEQSPIAVLMDDSLIAIWTYLHYGATTIKGQAISIVGLPHGTLTEESIEPLGDCQLIIAASPDADMTGRGLRLVADRARFLYLPHSINDLVKMKVDKDEFSWILRQGKVWG